jgi:hypothetical protein
MIARAASLAFVFCLFFAAAPRATSAFTSRAPLRLASTLVKSASVSQPGTSRKIFNHQSSLRMSTATNEITVISQASEDVIKKMGCKSWPTWGCGVSKFPWTYGDTETW